MSSEFSPIPGYEAYYSINRQGDVVSHYTGLFLKYGTSAGYPRVTLYRPGRGGKGLTIHRLLAQLFIPNPNNLPQVNHIDGDRTNFKLSNLEWITSKGNVQDGYDRGRQTWNKGAALVDRTRTCEFCGSEYKYRRKDNRFCGPSCSAKWRVKNMPEVMERGRNTVTGRIEAIELFKQGILKEQSDVRPE